jgi:hypothetical protein
MNNLETQYTEAVNSFEPELFTAFVFSGAVPTKDGSIANQLDVPAYVAFLKQSDNTLRRRSTTTTTMTTATPSTTYYLYLQPNGNLYWATTNSPATNSLAICTVTTDGSGNISVVTDARTTATTLLSGMAGRATLPTLTGLTVFGSSSLDNGAITSNGSGNLTATALFSSGGFLNMGAAVGGIFPRVYWSTPIVVISPPASGAANGVVFQAWDGTTSYNPFSVGGQYGAAPAWIDKLGNYNGSAGTGIPTTRNAVAASVPIYTGTTTPSSPPTGSIWIKA